MTSERKENTSPLRRASFPGVIFSGVKTMNDDEIRSAIENSRKSGQIVSVAVECTVSQLHSLFSGPLVCYLFEVACAWKMCEIEDNKVDVWGWTDDTPKSEQDWRIIVQCLPEQVEA